MHPGNQITGATPLKQGDRLILGNNFVFRFTLCVYSSMHGLGCFVADLIGLPCPCLRRFNDPNEEGKEKDGKVSTWQQAMDEFSEKQGLRFIAARLIFIISLVIVERGRISQSLTGETAKLEKEDAIKRQELEARLKEMEDVMTGHFRYGRALC